MLLDLRCMRHFGPEKIKKKDKSVITTDKTLEKNNRTLKPLKCLTEKSWGVEGNGLIR